MKALLRKAVYLNMEKVWKILKILPIKYNKNMNKAISILIL